MGSLEISAYGYGVYMLCLVISVVFPDISILYFIVYLLSPMFLCTVSVEFPTGSSIISYGSCRIIWFLGSSFGITSNRICILLYFLCLAVYSAVTMIYVLFHMGPADISYLSFYIPYDLYAISYGRTNHIICYLSEILAMVYMQFPIFSR